MTLVQLSRLLCGLDCKNERCLHSIWNTDVRILTKLARKHHLDRDEKWLDFGDFGPFFKVTVDIRVSNSGQICLQTPVTGGAFFFFFFFFFFWRGHKFPSDNSFG